MTSCLAYIAYRSLKAHIFAIFENNLFKFSGNVQIRLVFNFLKISQVLLLCSHKGTFVRSWPKCKTYIIRFFAILYEILKKKQASGCNFNTNPRPTFMLLETSNWGGGGGGGGGRLVFLFGDVPLISDIFSEYGYTYFLQNGDIFSSLVGILLAAVIGYI